MSLFQDKSDYFLKGDDQLDVFHLRPHGCDVMFSHYEADTQNLSVSNSTQCKCLVIQGSVSLNLNQNQQDFTTGEWFEIPANTLHDVHYLTDCSIIEFWFEAKH
ncbi:hypothetical protein FT643_21040 [Ketobacter sp. MCCC 1A13808]|uniref:hypothetical protein n=1 Tax=Ketobacter sp. MCCC 1A13808 TaxID=2602738 RepID=UPI000F1E9CD4|nr:hypothetical protein [Ketobacter sp. MCCC 1A13808]MVF14628.1 hypothetical protein [Ketobacter sp. MCCC 1A13808]RLP52604.1 MAG: hypothetical protein D6160_20275 [Ketobacter sp.]